MFVVLVGAVLLLAEPSEMASDPVKKLIAQTMRASERPEVSADVRSYLHAIREDLETLDQIRREQQAKLPADYGIQLNAHTKSLQALPERGGGKDEFRLVAGVAADVRAKAEFAKHGGGTMRLRTGTNLASKIVFSDDGRSLVAAGNSRVVSWDRGTGKELWRIEDERSEPMIKLAIAGPNECFVSGKNANLLFVKEGRLQRKQRVEGGRIDLLAGSAPARLLAVGKYDGWLDLWDARDLRWLVRLSEPESVGKGTRTPRLTSVSFSLDGKLLCAVRPAQGVTIWEINGDRQSRLLRQHEPDLAFARFTPDARGLYAVTRSGSVTQWDLLTRKVVNRWDSKQRTILDVTISPDGKTLALASLSGDRSGEVGCWQAEGSRLLKKFRYSQTVLSVSFSPDGQSLAAAQVGGWVDILPRWFANVTWSPFQRIQVKVQTFRAGQEEDKCEVYYVTSGHANDPAPYPRFPVLSTPTAHGLYAGAYFFWATKDGLSTPKTSLSVDTQSSQLQLNFP